MREEMSRAVDREKEIIALKERNRELLIACKQALYLLKGREHDQFLRDVIAKSQS